MKAGAPRRNGVPGSHRQHIIGSHFPQRFFAEAFRKSVFNLYIRMANRHARLISSIQKTRGPMFPITLVQKNAWEPLLTANFRESAENGWEPLFPPDFVRFTAA